MLLLSRLVLLGFFYFCFSSVVVLAQPLVQDTLYADIDQDGQTDQWVVSRNRGSMLSGLGIEAQIGHDGPKLSFGYSFYFSDFANLLLLPNAWDTPTWRPFHALLDSTLSLSSALNGEEPDLRWLLDAYRLRREGDGLFHRYYPVPLQWQSLPLEVPANGWYQLAGAELQILGPMLSHYFEGEEPTLPPDANQQGWLRYQGRNHFLAWNPADSAKAKDLYRKVWNKGTQILWQTAHGLVLQEQNRFAWIFTSSGTLTGGPSKLRRASLQGVLVEGEYVLVHHLTPLMPWNQFLIVDLQTGVVGDVRLPEKIKLGPPQELAIKLKRGQLSFERSAGRFAPEDYYISLDWKELTSKLRASAIQE